MVDVATAATTSRAGCAERMLRDGLTANGFGFLTANGQSTGDLRSEAREYLQSAFPGVSGVGHRGRINQPDMQHGHAPPNKGHVVLPGGMWCRRKPAALVVADTWTLDLHATATTT